MRLKFLLSVLMAAILVGCDKENAPSPDTSIKDFDFTFRYDAPLTTINQFELLLTQKDGKILLDTLLSTRTQHALTAKTNDSKLNLTLITLDAANRNMYSITTYNQVNPDKWHIIAGFTTEVNAPTLAGEIRYANIPYDAKAFFSSKQSNWTGLSWPNPAHNYLIANYNRLLSTDLAYILLPTHGKYMFTDASSDLMSVDFSNANTSTKLKYNRPANITKFRTFLHGYSKAGDYTHMQPLFNSDYMSSEAYDLQYPSTVIEEFELNVYYTDADGYQHRYYHIGSAVPQIMPFSEKSNFKVAKSDFSDFQVSFTDNLPSLYFSHWALATADVNANWYIYSSPEEVSYHPKRILEELKPKLLAGKSVAGFKLSSVQTIKAPNYTYQSYCDYYGSPEARARKAMKETQQIGKSF